jgi:hypothetical protein
MLTLCGEIMIDTTGSHFTLHSHQMYNMETSNNFHPNIATVYLYVVSSERSNCLFIDKLNPPLENGIC